MKVLITIYNELKRHRLKSCLINSENHLKKLQGARSSKMSMETLDFPPVLVVSMFHKTI